MPNEEESRSIDFDRLHLWNMEGATREHTGFHMPGHSGGRLFTREYAERLLLTDTTELESTDDLHDPSGPARLALDRISEIYGSKESLFITTGSTTGIFVMLASVLTEESFLLLPRTVHISVLNLLAKIGCRYGFITLSGTPSTCGLFAVATAQDLTEALERFPEATDILVCSPDFYGQCCDLPAFARIAHRHGCRLLVDEAHGAHLRFCPAGTPPDAMQSGADISVQSLHKTLPALTMASLLHVSSDALASGRVIMARVWQMLRIFETSSPSFLIAASSEYAIEWMHHFGRRDLPRRIERIRDFTRSASVLLRNRNEGDAAVFRDPMRIVLSSGTAGVLMPPIHKRLAKLGIDAEFSDLTRIVMIPSPWQREEDFDRCLDALHTICADGESSLISTKGASDVKRTDRLYGELLSLAPQYAKPLRTVVFGNHPSEEICLTEAEGRISLVTIAPYPPGIALLWPGERIDRERISLLLRLTEAGLPIQGIRDRKIRVIS